MEGITRIDRTSYDEFEPPTDDQIGQILYVDADTDMPGFRAVARTNAAGVNEWYEERDTFQADVTPSAVSTDAGAGDAYFTGFGVADLTDWNEVRVSFRVSTAGTTAEARLKYSIDNFATDADLTSVANAMDLSATGIKISDWEPIPAGARGPVAFGLVSFNGDGSEDPAVVSVVAHFRR